METMLSLLEKISLALMMGLEHGQAEIKGMQRKLLTCSSGRIELRIDSADYGQD